MLAGVTQNQGTPVLRVLDAWGCPILWHICRRKAWRLWSMRRYRWRVISFVVPSNFLDHFWGSFSNFPWKTGLSFFFCRASKLSPEGLAQPSPVGAAIGWKIWRAPPPSLIRHQCTMLVGPRLSDGELLHERWAFRGKPWKNHLPEQCFHLPQKVAKAILHLYVL